MNDDLTPEEEARLVELEANDPNQQVEEPLSPTEAARLDILEAEAAEPVNDTTQLEAFGHGVVEGVPFAKDLAAGIESAADILMSPDKSIEDFSEGYKRELDEWNVDINKAETKHPGTFFAGDIAGGVATTLVPFGIGAKLATGVKGAIAFGAASGFSRSEDREISDALMGGLFGAAGAGAGKLVGAGFKKLDPGSRTIAYFREMSSSGKKAINDHLGKFYSAGKKGADGKIVKFSDAAAKMGKELLDEDLFKSFDNLEDTHVRVLSKKAGIGEHLDEILTTVDDTLGINHKFDGKKIKDELMSTVQRKLADKSTTAAEKQALAPVLNELNTFIRGVNKDGIEEGFEFTVRELNNKRKAIADLAFKAGRNPADEVKGYAAKLYADIESNLRSKVDDTVQSVLTNKGDDIGVNVFKEVKKRYQTMSILDDTLREQINKPAASSFYAGMMDAVNFRRAAFALGVGFHNKAAALGLVASDIALSHPKTPSTVIAGMQTLNKYITMNPNSKIASRFGRAMMNKGASELYLEEETTIAIASATLASKPMARTNDALVANSNAVATLLRDRNPEAARLFNKGIEENDDAALSQAGAMLAKMPEAKGLIEEGQGWEGKLYDPAEIQAAFNEVEANKDMSLAQKLVHKKALKESGLKPQPQPEEDRFLIWKSNRGEEPKI